MAELDNCPTCGSPNKRVARDDCFNAWHRDAVVEPRPVWLMVATDWGEGFQIEGADPASLESVPPGALYETACVPQQAVEIHGVIVRDFWLVLISAASPAARATITTLVNATGACRRYRLEPPLTIGAGERVLVHLMNDLETPQKPKCATLVAYKDGALPPPERRVPRDWHAENGRIIINSPISSTKLSCPSCGANAPDLRLLLESKISDHAWCKDAWHEQPRSGPVRHAPQIADAYGRARFARGHHHVAQIIQALQ